MVKAKISFRQFAMAAFAASFAPASRLMFYYPLREAYKMCWISPLAAFLPLVGVAWMLKKLLEGHKGLLECMQDCLGRRVGVLFGLLLGAWMLFCAGVIVRSSGERMVSTVYNTGSPAFFSLTMLALACFAAAGKRRFAVRTMELCALLLLLTLGFVYLMALPDLKSWYLLPVNVLELDDVVRAALPIIGTGSVWLYLSFLGEYSGEEFRMKTAVLWIAVYCVMLALHAAATVGVLGPETALTRQFAFFVMISNISVFEIFDRIEPSVIMLWLITDLSYVTMLIMAAAEPLKKFIGRKRAALLSFPVVYAAGRLAGENSFELSEFIDLFYPWINLGVAIGTLVFLLVLKNIKNKGRKMKKGVDKGGKRW